jgi:hypothetical protein
MLGSCQKIGRTFSPGKVLAALLLAILLPLISLTAQAQNRVYLDDLSIKGELLNDNRLRISSRESHKITDRVSYRNNFRKEITDSLEIAWPAATAAQSTTEDDAGGAQ